MTDDMNRTTTTQLLRRTVAILFADVVGWTQMCARLGDERAKALVDPLFAEMGEIVTAHRGQVVKRIGDELMCAFDTVESAAWAACAMQRHATARAAGAEEALSLRIGFHLGPVTPEDGDFFGDTVNVAARVAGSATRDRILATRSAAQQLPEDLSSIVFPWGSEELKGKDEPVEVVELWWREDGVRPTRIAEKNPETGDTGPRRVTVVCQGRRYVLELGGKPLRFGRGDFNAIRIDDPTCHVSGSHGQIEFRGGKAELVDTSRNGIFVAFGDGPFFRVSKRLLLRDQGRMSLGRPGDDPQAVIIEFSLE